MTDAKTLDFPTPAAVDHNPPKGETLPEGSGFQMCAGYGVTLEDVEEREPLAPWEVEECERIDAQNRLQDRIDEQISSGEQ